MKTQHTIAALLATLTTLACAQSSSCLTAQAVALEALVSCIETGSKTEVACNAAYEKALAQAGCDFGGDTFLAPSTTPAAAATSSSMAKKPLTTAPPYPFANGTTWGNMTVGASTTPVSYTTTTEPCPCSETTASLPTGPYMGAAVRRDAAMGAAVAVGAVFGFIFDV